MAELIFISVLGFAMGIINAISGGGGVFAIPILMAFGIPTIDVLALNKASDFGTITGALRNYYKSDTIDWKLALYAILPLGIGSALGSYIIIGLPEHIRQYLIIAGVISGIYFLLRPPGEKTKPRKSLFIFGLIALVIAGMWGGGLGVAGGTFSILVLVYFFQKTYLQAMSSFIIAGFPSNLISVVILSLASQASIASLLTIYISSFIGAWCGSHLAIQKGSAFIRIAMVFIAVMMLVKVIIDLF